MKAKITKKKKQTKVDFEDKFLNEQKYAEQGFHLTDPKIDLPDFKEENGIAPEEESEKEKKDQEGN